MTTAKQPTSPAPPAAPRRGRIMAQQFDVFASLQPASGSQQDLACGLASFESSMRCLDVSEFKVMLQP